MTMIARAALVAFVLTHATATQAGAQVVGQEPAVLRGVTAVDAQVAISWVDAITKDGGPTETQYEEAFLNQFKAGLRRGGLTISETAPNYLFCSIALLYEDDGLVSAAQSVEYHEMMGPDQQWAITWTKMQVFTVGLQNFGGQDDAQWCASEFLEDWNERG